MADFLGDRMKNIGFIGAGNMAEAFIKGILKSGVRTPGQITAADIRDDRLQYLQSQYGIHTTADNGKLVSESDITFLSVKPQIMPEVAAGISGKFRKKSVVVTIAAGITSGYLAEKLGDVPIIRTMPNTPAMVGEGVTGIYNRSADTAVLTDVRELLDAVGKTVVVEDESLLDVVTAVSGSGPAYFFLLMEEMTAAAKTLGLSDETAVTLVCQTALGAAKLASLSLKDETPADLRRKVTSPGGTTEAAISHFQKNNFGEIVREAIRRARDRGKELSSQT